MYEKHFKLREKPFSLRPDPAFLYLGRKHGIAYSVLEYGLLNEAGIIVITGEIGAGKTTLIRHLLNRVDQACTIGLISHTHHAFGELIQWVSEAFGLPSDGKDKVALYRQFVDFLIQEYARGHRVVLIIDEAQNMDRDALEELRVISNINADKDLVLQILLVGQPELRTILNRPDMRQFAQRVWSDYHLTALDEAETAEYVRHRVRVAGGDPEVFERDTLPVIHRQSGGVPRVINALCDQSLVYAFAESAPTVSRVLVDDLIREKTELGAFGFVEPDPGPTAPRRPGPARSLPMSRRDAH